MLIPQQIQAFVTYPQNFDKSKKYPLAYLIHGGPQGSWADSWSTRWNPKVFADQGYVVVAPNPTGSTGWGDELTDAIQNNWGTCPAHYPTLHDTDTANRRSPLRRPRQGLGIRPRQP